MSFAIARLRGYSREMIALLRTTDGTTPETNLNVSTADLMYFPYYIFFDLWGLSDTPNTSRGSAQHTPLRADRAAV